MLLNEAGANSKIRLESISTPPDNDLRPMNYRPSNLPVLVPTKHLPITRQLPVHYVYAEMNTGITAMPTHGTVVTGQGQTLPHINLLQRSESLLPGSRSHLYSHSLLRLLTRRNGCDSVVSVA